MIKFMSSWVKGLGLAIVIISILEMLLPNNKTKKYIRMVMGIYILFTMISPFISNKNILNANIFNLEDYIITETSSTLDQRSMDERIQELYIQELEKDITKKLKERGYEVINCKVKAQISDKAEETKITKIKIKAQKLIEENKSNQEEANLENKNEIVTQIKKINPVNTTIKQEETETIDKQDKQNIKQFLIKEYEVDEKCLEIN